MRGLTSLMSSKLTPSRFAVPGRQFSIMTSTPDAISRAIFTPRGSFKFSATERLPALHDRKALPRPAAARAASPPWARIQSPCNGRSILIVSAPSKVSM